MSNWSDVRYILMLKSGGNYDGVPRYCRGMLFFGGRKVDSHSKRYKMKVKGTFFNHLFKTLQP